MARILLVRHCEATGQEPSAPLTELGIAQSNELATFLCKFFKISRIFSSPFLRAQQTIIPTSEALGIPFVVEDGLRERDLLGRRTDLTSEEEDGFLEASMQDYSLKLEGGESSQEALDRALEVFDRIKQTRSGIDVIVSHGNLIALILNHFGSAVKIDELSRPDVFLLSFDKECRIDRLWTNDGPLHTLERPSARAILLNHDHQRVFMFQLSDSRMASSSEVGRLLWITPGGGVDDGEALETALHRELFEELGLDPSDYSIHGKLWYSVKPMVWQGHPRLFINNYFVVTLSEGVASFDFSNHTEDERVVLKQGRWWSLEELESTSELVVPPQLKSIPGNLDSWLKLNKTVMIEEEL